MKRILEITMVLGLVGALTLIAGCSKAKAPQAKEEPASAKSAAIPKKKDIIKEPIKNESPRKEDAIDLGKDVKLNLLLIPAGKFKMGSPASEVGRKSDEKQHDVTLTKPFYMGKYEVTQAQWEAVMGKNPSTNKGAMLPVTDVSWKDCQDFIKKLNAKTNGDYRLPTESEWEYACRAGTTTAYSFGDKITPKDANFNESKIHKTVAVGSYKPNAFGLYDMHGNVWEWCEDRLEEYPFAATDPKGPAEGNTHRVLRGGSLIHDVSFARSSRRYDYYLPTDRNRYTGFRLVRNP